MGIFSQTHTDIKELIIVIRLHDSLLFPPSFMALSRGQQMAGWSLCAAGCWTRWCLVLIRHEGIRIWIWIPPHPHRWAQWEPAAAASSAFPSNCSGARRQLATAGRRRDKELLCQVEEWLADRAFRSDRKGVQSPWQQQVVSGWSGPSLCLPSYTNTPHL